jgi:cytochrome c3-like protein
MPGRDRMNSKLFWLLLLLACPAQAQNFVGAERCGQCHEFEYKMWLAGPHAKAHLALTADQLKDSKCNNCHTHAVEADSKLTGVQCERCHGPGKYYQAAYVMKDRELARAVGLIDPTAASCQQCHTEGAPSVEPFDFKTMWARIDHGKAAREVWERSRSRPPRASK